MSTRFGELYSNSEKFVFRKGIWELTEDGEKTWSLYCNGKCVEPIVDENRYHLFDQGFMLYTNNRLRNSFRLFQQDDLKPIFSAVGDNISVKIENGLIIFKIDNKPECLFDSVSLTKVKENKDNQLGISFDI